MKILVTGANGYLGKGVVKHLLNSGHQIIATDYRSELIDSRAIIIEADLFEVNDPFEYFDKPDILLHLAWRDGFIHNSESHLKDLHKHYDFISKMVNSGIKHVAVFGTMHEIGFYEGSINESTPANPQSLYGISKNALRLSIQELCKENNIIFQWLRGFYIVGNTPDGNSIFSKIIQAASRGEKKFPFTSGLNQFDFINYDDFCDSVTRTVSQNKINGIINICNGFPESLANRVERFIIENKLDIELEYGVFPDRPYDSKAVWGNSEKLKSIKRG
uniref:CpsJ n=2 Tax=Streptococcus iniae TaxID=1346 RepID=Q2KM68_STRIN|nr:CpsJ [Streptococcus iniae]